MSQPLARESLLETAMGVPLEPVPWPLLEARGIEVIVRRDDLIHPLLSGNKFYKLFFNLQQARLDGKSTLLSFGGAYSNHIHALAAAGKLYGFNTVGVIRGQRPTQLSPTLEDAQQWGMQLHFVDRATYRQKHTLSVQAQLENIFGEVYTVPEGGGNLKGAQGCRLIAEATQAQIAFDTLCMACGTGSTLAGVASGLAPPRRALGIAVIKGDLQAPGGLQEGVDGMIGSLGRNPDAGNNQSPVAGALNWQLMGQFHGGGYGKCSPSLADFIRRFERDTAIPLEPVYTGKLFWAIEQLALEGYWSRGTRLVALHSGGLQGRRGFAGILQ